MEDPHLPQVRRILDKLRLAEVRRLSCFGSGSHQFRLRSRATEDELRAFELEQGAVLPAEYRSFLLHAGNGGAGPYYGLHALSVKNGYLRADSPPPGWLAEPCPLEENFELGAGWDEVFGEEGEPFFGTLELGTQGCTYGTLLVVTGELRGRILYGDLDGKPPYLLYDKNFLDWYERWLDELLGGYVTD